MMKERCSKKRIHVTDNTKEASTLDDIHNNTIKKFNETNKEKQDILTKLSLLKDIRVQIEQKIYDQENQFKPEYRSCLWNSNLQIKEQILDLSDKLKDINNCNEIEYYEKTSKILFDYYDIVDKNINIQTPINKKKYTILDALNVQNDDDKLLINDESNISNKSVIEKDKTSLVNEYLSITENKYVNHIGDEFTDEICKNCKEENMTILQYEALSICIKCGHQEVLLAEQNRPIMIHDKKDNMHYSYKRINHFREWCNQVQGKESTDIPNEIFEKILEELKKEKITDTTKLTPKYMRSILKKIRTHKYYEHSAYIINRINGVTPPQFSPELEQKLANMFMQTQPLFIKYAPANRLNFISYSYILHKFFLILDMPEYLPLFPLLKSRQKIAQNEETMKKICQQLDWKWIPSI